MNLGVLVSGNGSNLQAIIDSKVASVKVVISDKKSAYALERAKKAGIEAVFINPKDFAEKNTYELEVVKVLKKHNVDLVCLAGYMKIVGEALLSNYQGKMINIHPALLPSFPGLHGQKQAFDHGVKVSGATVHFVDSGCDTGPIILQAAVPVLDNDTEETLSARILSLEHKIYPQAIKLYAEGRLKIEGRKVHIEPAAERRG
ncbi:phosphoribosylglycinamide formyltransferase [Candidatus Saganbacteria bacterium]|nr:phosphoribosylglycinamide formyltransferase [Candidatus Saganbacteria bacterium]